jgi:hypothetical protein
MSRILFIACVGLLAFVSCKKANHDEPSVWIKGKYFKDNGCSYPVIQVLDSTHYDLGEKRNEGDNKDAVYIFRVDNLCNFNKAGLKEATNFILVSLHAMSIALFVISFLQYSRQNIIK